MAKTFDKEAWLKQKTEKLEAAKNALEEGLRKLETSEDWQRTLKAMARAGALSVLRYSFGNALLVQLAKPGAAYAATYKTWQQADRQVRVGEQGVAILRPIFKSRREDGESVNDESKPPIIGFGIVTVFTLEQTDGEPLVPPALPDVTEEELFDQSVETLRKVALDLPGAPVSSISLRPRMSTDHPRALGWYAPATKEIVVVTDDRPRAHQFKTLCHEIAHALLHPAGQHHERAEAEVEAESTAFVVCHALGLDTGDYSFPYVSTWARGEDALATVGRVGDRILRASRTILDALIPQAADAASEAA